VINGDCGYRFTLFGSLKTFDRNICQPTGIRGFDYAKELLNREPGADSKSRRSCVVIFYF
jgi:hypothetical protein